MRTSQLRRVMGTVITCVLLAAACGDDSTGGAQGDGPQQASSATDGKPQTGGTLRYFALSELATLDTASCGQSLGAGGDRIYAIYDTLFTLDADGNIVPALAESVTTNDAKSWTLTLRPDVKFSDATPLDAAAVKVNLARHADPAFASRARAAASNIDTMEVIDATTLRITLKIPQGQFFRSLARGLGCIGSPTAITEMGAGFGTAPKAAGPFMVESWVRDSQLVLVKNPNYYRAGQPYLDRVTIDIVTDASVRFDALATTREPAAMSVTRAEDYKRARDMGMQPFNKVLGGGQGMFFNTARAPFDDPRVRQAFSLILDPDDFNATVHEGELVLATGLFDEASPFWVDELQQPRRDATKAQSLLDEYIDDKNDGAPLEVTLTYVNSQKADGEYLQTYYNTQLRNVNVKVELLQTAEIIDKVYTRKDYQFAFAAVLFTDPDEQLPNYYSSTSPANLFGISNPELDALLKTQRESLDDAVRKDAITKIQRILMDEDINFWLYKNNTGSVVNGAKIHWSTWVENLPKWEEIWIEQ